MNCRHIEKWLPLYIAGDLQAHKARKVSEHLDSCSECRKLAQEYGESQAWLRSYAPPEFDSDFLADLRAAVQSEIQKGRKPAMAWPLTLWIRNPIPAAALALLLIGGGIALLVSLTPHQPISNDAAQNTALVPTVTYAPIPPQKREDLNQPAPVEPESGKMAQKRAASSIPDSENPRVEKPTSGQAVELAKPTSLPVVAAGGGDNRKEPLRIEIQTADPNIRIIWFATKT